MQKNPTLYCFILTKKGFPINPLTPKAKWHFLQIQDYKLYVHVWYTILKLLIIMNEKSYGFEINGLKMKKFKSSKTL